MTAHSDMIVAGIDPGKAGALAILFPDSSVEFHDVPVIETKTPSRTNKSGYTVKTVPAWTEWQDAWVNALVLAGVDCVFIELVTAGQNGVKQGVQSMFNFGGTLRFAHAIALSPRPRPRVEFVTPAVWKPKFGLLHGSKGASREKCRTLFPTTASKLKREKDDGRAEAALIAEYGRKHL